MDAGRLAALIVACLKSIEETLEFGTSQNISGNMAETSPVPGGMIVLP